MSKNGIPESDDMQEKLMSFGQWYEKNRLKLSEYDNFSGNGRFQFCHTTSNMIITYYLYDMY